MSTSASMSGPSEIPHSGHSPGTASLLSSISNLANTALGAGLLTLPRAMKLAGWAGGIIILVGTALISATTGYFISAGIDKVGPGASIRTLCNRALPHLAIYGDLAAAITCLGGGTAFTVIASTGLRDTFVGTHGARWPWTLLTMGFSAPIAFLSSMDSLRFTSMAALLTLAYVTLLVALYSFGLDGDGGLLDPFAAGARVPAKGTVIAFGQPLSALRALASVSSAFSCHFNIPAIQAEMERPTPARVWAWYGGTFGFAFCLYTIVAMCGYMTFGDAVAANILSMYPSNALTNTAQVGISLVVIFSYPLVGFGFRLSAVTLVQELRGCCGRSRASDAFGAKTSEERARASQESSVSMAAEVEPFTLRLSALRNSTVAIDADSFCRITPHAQAAIAEGDRGGASTWVPPPPPPPIHALQRLLSGLFVTDPMEVYALLLFIGVSFTVCFLTEDLGLILDFVGAVGSMSISYIVPALLYACLCTPSKAPEEPACLYPLAVAVVPYGFAVLVVSLTLMFSQPE